MLRHITAATLAITLALPAPAQSEELDATGAVVGLLSLLAIIHLATKDEGLAPSPAPVATPKPKSPKVVPSSCIRRNQGHDGPRRLLYTRCLRKADVRVRDLPRRCATQGVNRHGPYKGFRIRCVQRAGWMLR